VWFLAARSPRRGTTGSASVKSRRKTLAGKKTPTVEAAPIEEIAERAARLGITPERVLREYGHIAFADLSHIIEWGPDGWRLKAPSEMTTGDMAAICEIAPGTDPKHPRVKLYDRKAALDAIARHLGMFPPPPRQRENDAAAEQEEEDPREFLARELDRLAAEAGKG
jgi:phage terminase small subunit